MRGHQVVNQFVQCPYSRCCFQGPRGDQGLLRPSLASRLLPDEAQASDSRLHLQPAQGVPGGATIPPLGGRHQAQGAAAHLPELATVPGGWLCASISQPQMTRRRNAIKSWYETQTSWASLSYFPRHCTKTFWFLETRHEHNGWSALNLVENVKVPWSKLLMYNCLHLLKKCKGQNQFVFFLETVYFFHVNLFACTAFWTDCEWASQKTTSEDREGLREWRQDSSTDRMVGGLFFAVTCSMVEAVP